MSQSECLTGFKTYFEHCITSFNSTTTTRTGLLHNVKHLLQKLSNVRLLPFQVCVGKRSKDAKWSRLKIEEIFTAAGGGKARYLHTRFEIKFKDFNKKTVVFTNYLCIHKLSFDLLTHGEVGREPYSVGLVCTLCSFMLG